MVKRYRKETNGRAAEVWVEVGLLRYKAELYEEGTLLKRSGGFIPRKEQEYAERLVTSGDLAALVRVHPDRSVSCTWAR